MQTYSKHLLYLSSQLLHCRNMLLVFIRRLSEWVVLYVDTHIDLYVCVCVINAWQRLLSASPLPEEKSHHAPAEGSRTVSASSFPAANWHQEVVPPHNLNERFPCAVKKNKKTDEISELTVQRGVWNDPAASLRLVINGVDETGGGNGLQEAHSLVRVCVSEWWITTCEPP